MIRIFRNIRQKLAAENKVMAYLRYAIGEILLVVIGILIALQINTWNTNRNNSIKESVYIKSLRNEIKIQLETIDVQINFEKSYVHSAQQVIEVLNDSDNNKPDLEEKFYLNLTNLLERKTFKIIDATYTDLISTGELNLISNDNAKKEIVVYYQELKRIESVIQNNNTHIVDNIFLPAVQRIGYYYPAAKYLDLLQKKFAINYLNRFKNQEASYSASLILQPENRLLLLNLLKHRLVVAVNHFDLMEELRLKTQTLIDELKTNNEDL